jgi:hypothetical protein
MGNDPAFYPFSGIYPQDRSRYRPVTNNTVSLSHSTHRLPVIGGGPTRPGPFWEDGAVEASTNAWMARSDSDVRGGSFRSRPDALVQVSTRHNHRRLAPPESEQRESNVTQYDISVRVGNTTYLVLYTPPNPSNVVNYWVGSNLRVLVGSNTLTLNSVVSGDTEVLILRRETLPAQSPDWSQACGQYFSKRVQHLSEILVLTTNQQAEIKPILEQEAGDVTEICLNPELSRVDKVNQYKRLVRASDEKIKPVLSVSQSQQLANLRKKQKQDLEEIIAKQMSTQSSD